MTALDHPPPSVRRFTSWPTWSEACRGLCDWLPPGVVTDLGVAFRFAAHWHDAQTRPSGQPYVRHLLEAVEIVVACDQPHTAGCLPVLAAALLHDVVEDTGCTLHEVDGMFGPTVAGYVDWLTQAAGSDRREYLARFADAPPPVLTVKLADRYSNIQRLHTHPRPDAQRRYYAETVTWFLPLAERILFYADLYTTWAEQYRYLGDAPESRR